MIWRCIFIQLLCLYTLKIYRHIIKYLYWPLDMNHFGYILQLHQLSKCWNFLMSGQNYKVLRKIVVLLAPLFKFIFPFTFLTQYTMLSLFFPYIIPRLLLYHFPFFIDVSIESNRLVIKRYYM